MDIENFKKKIKPQIGRIRNDKKCADILDIIERGSGLNNGKGIRISDIPLHLQPANHYVKRLRLSRFVEETEPSSGSKLVMDTINDIRVAYGISELIEEYHKNFVEHIKKDKKARDIVKRYLSIISDEELYKWLGNIDKHSFEVYNGVVEELAKQGIDVGKESYGTLYWRNAAKFYRATVNTRNIMAA